jgi:hypothetical protein
VSGWAASLDHARLRAESSRFEVSQAQAALEAARGTLAAKEAEHAAAVPVAGQDSRSESRRRRRESPQPDAPAVSADHVQRALAACEHARKQLRFAVLRMAAAQEEVANAEGVVMRCTAGIDQSTQLVRSAEAAVEQAGAALALAHEGVSLSDAAIAALLRGQAGAARCAAGIREAAAGAAALSEELGKAVVGARGVREGLTEHHRLQSRAGAALDDLRDSLAHVATVRGA